ncbi:16S rRNA (uracil(1498)-N(3))-methyltransferase [Bhargavaea beijingensis]|uniref:16S rRNA (uracil(1498)-N(3))-methyltransferase n=1 Tax=Bhargavaea beijingensis TaxID=426756 RepID=UPI002224E992|nr:16S rRNA (uracil(1498)-N(3))-methyltransferase [Bhargavaea beijingensis]MCW1927075.1 16S rRNA (uracil(1498)-N(3))-methyltransferase [Bhargavaea beijingensis]
MQRYFLNDPFDGDSLAIISGEDARHIMKVMRMSEGAKIIAVSGGEAFESEITALADGEVEIRRLGDALPSNEMPVHVTVAAGLPKGDKLDLVVQKGTELGMSGLVPFEAERSIVKWDNKKSGKKIERLRKIAKEAAEQSHRNIIPGISEVTGLDSLVRLAESFDLLLIADEEAAKDRSGGSIAAHLENVYHGQKVLAVFGPEGGISRKEADRFREAGFSPIALGPRILRAETAPLYALSAISSEIEGKR